jgi:hypothetical protein
MPKIFNRIFETSLTIGGLKTFSCPCVVSSKQSHSNAWIIAFYSFRHKLIKHHSRCEHSLPNDFDVRGPFHELEGAHDFLFQQWALAFSLVRNYYLLCNIWFLTFFNFATSLQTFFDPFNIFPCNLKRGRASKNITLGIVGRTSLVLSLGWIIHQLHQLQELY